MQRCVYPHHILFPSYNTTATRTSKKTSTKQQKNEKRKFDSQVEFTDHSRRNPDRVDIGTRIGIGEYDAKTVHKVHPIAIIPHFLVAVEEKGMCGAADGFLAPTLEPFIPMQPICPSLRLCSQGRKIPRVTGDRSPSTRPIHKQRHSGPLEPNPAWSIARREEKR